MQSLPMFATRRRSVFLTICTIAIPVVLLLTILSHNVFAQNTFVIKDGDRVIVHTTYASDPAVALDEVGVQADPGEYSATISKDGDYDITVKRLDYLTVQYCGQNKQVLIEDDTVGELLARAGIPSGEGYEVSCNLSARPVEGMTIRIDRLTIREEVYTVEVPFEVQKVEEPTMPKGMQMILKEGVVGYTLCTAQVEYRNTEEINRVIVNQETVRQMQPQVVAVGTGKSVGKRGNQTIVGDGFTILPSGDVIAN